MWIYLRQYKNIDVSSIKSKTWRMRSFAQSHILISKKNDFRVCKDSKKAFQSWKDKPAISFGCWNKTVLKTSDYTR